MCRWATRTRSIILFLATPLALGALCGVLNERCGVVNIGIEGIMLMAAFFAYLTGFALHNTIGSGPSLALGIVVAVLRRRAARSGARTAHGLGASRSDHRGHNDEHPRVWRDRLPRAVGEHPRAADTVGIDVYRQRYQKVINGMTGGRGFIALAAMIFGRWTPIGAFGGALLFGTATALGVVVNVRVPEGDLGTILKSIPTFWYAALPYLITIVILAGVVGRSTPPAADGVPYVKEGKG